MAKKIIATDFLFSTALGTTAWKLWRKNGNNLYGEKQKNRPGLPGGLLYSVEET